MAQNFWWLSIALWVLKWKGIIQIHSPAGYRNYLPNNLLRFPACHSSHRDFTASWSNGFHYWPVQGINRFVFVLRWNQFLEASTDWTHFCPWEQQQPKHLLSFWHDIWRHYSVMFSFTKSSSEPFHCLWGMTSGYALVDHYSSQSAKPDQAQTYHLGFQELPCQPVYCIYPQVISRTLQYRYPESASLFTVL